MIIIAFASFRSINEQADRLGNNARKPLIVEFRKEKHDFSVRSLLHLHFGQNLFASLLGSHFIHIVLRCFFKMWPFKGKSDKAKAPVGPALSTNLEFNAATQDEMDSSTHRKRKTTPVPAAPVATAASTSEEKSAEKA